MQRLTFGKHKGKRVDDVAHVDLPYLLGLLAADWLRTDEPAAYRDVRHCVIRQLKIEEEIEASVASKPTPADGYRVINLADITGIDAALGLV